MSASVAKILDEAIAAAQVQAATLLVARDGEPLQHQAFGGGHGAARPRIDRIFDLASLTKVLATTSAVMMLLDEGRLALETRVSDVLSSLAPTACGALTVAQLLEHSSGLPAWQPYFEMVHSEALASGAARKRRVRGLVARSALEAPPGARVLYSDLGFILLDWLVERTARARLDRVFSRRVAAPLGLSHAFFIDLDDSDARTRARQRFSFAPTERCPWRRRRLVAEVHDDNTHAMGGISGHAGLFGSAYDVHVIARELVAAYHGERSIFARDVVRRFFDHRSRAPSGPSRALGWDLVSPERSSAGKRFGPRTVGHLGFTGTSLWIDLDARLWVVLLTNRVYYGRDPNPMPRLRPRLHDAALRAHGRRV
ncbi:MAG: beta-lactamase family protein [Myxococcales bacterium]|nr:beta-lactamase family protein [Myxococcales bacterium]